MTYSPAGGISASDLVDVQTKLESLGLDMTEARFYWSGLNSRWEVETVLHVFVAHQDNRWL